MTLRQFSNKTVLQAGMKVHISARCEETAHLYGLNADMRENFLGKIGIIVRGSPSPLGAVKVRLQDKRKSDKVWSFVGKDLYPLSIVIPEDIEKPEVKETKFNPDYL